MTDVIDISIDIETLSTKPNAFVVSIGAAAIGFELESYFEEAEQCCLHRDIDSETIKWHLTENSGMLAHYMQQMRDTGSTTVYVLDHLHQWFKHFEGQKLNVWMNSPSFDGVILRSLAQDVGYSLPWSYRHERDYRTLKALAEQRNPEEFALLPKQTNNVHDALADAKYQLEIISMCKTILNC